MPEIWNLSALCRCCLADGSFQRLDEPCVAGSTVEVYSDMLKETFGITIMPPPEHVSASHSICEVCIAQLRLAARFKRSVLDSEEKFHEYCRNEQAQSFIEFPVKVEFESGDSDSDRKDVKEIKESKTDLKHDDSSDYEAPDFSDYFDESVKKEVKNSQHGDNMAVTRAAAKLGIKKNVAAKKKQGTVIKKNKIKIDKSLEVKMETDKGISYSCKLCGDRYNKLRVLRIHINKTHLNGKNYSCVRCNIQFKSKTLYNEHVTTNVECRPYQCPYCPKKYVTQCFFNEHKNTHTNEKVFQCDLCSKTFRYKQTIRRHVAWHQGKARKFMCDLCGHKFNDKTNLRKHVEVVHEKRRDFQCEFCPKKYSTRKSLVPHRRLHTGEKPFVCDICSSAFRSTDLLKQHLQRGHADHVKVKDMPQKMYECIVCKETFDNRGRFRVHVRKHVGSLPHKCPLCTKDFSCRFSLKRHVDGHSGEKKHKCHLCELAFAQKGTLLRHLRNYHNPSMVVTKVKCDLCKKFVKDIKRHKQNHVIKPHRCELCEKSYPERNALNRHVKLVHLGKLHQCRLCPKRYTKAKGLQVHVEKTHGMKKEVEISFSMDSEEFTEDSLAAHIIENTAGRI